MLTFCQGSLKVMNVNRMHVIQKIMVSHTKDIYALCVELERFIWTIMFYVILVLECSENIQR